MPTQKASAGVSSAATEPGSALVPTISSAGFGPYWLSPWVLGRIHRMVSSWKMTATSHDHRPNPATVMPSATIDPRIAPTMRPTIIDRMTSSRYHHQKAERDERPLKLVTFEAPDEIAVPKVKGVSSGLGRHCPAICLVSGSLRDLAQVLGDRRKLVAVERARHMSFCLVEFREEPLHELLAGRCEFNGDEAPIALAALAL